MITYDDLTLVELAAESAPPGDADVPPLVAQTLADSILCRVDFTRPAGPDGKADRRVVTDPNVANVVTSERIIGGRHRLLLDLDVPAALVPSSTPGHSHLYVDADLDAGQLARLLEVLADAGVIEASYAAVSIARGHTALRLPNVKKEVADHGTY